jgi:hypothetical protein
MVIPGSFKNRILAAILAMAIALVSVLMGSTFGYSRGYRDGQKATNSWWIGKQSRYYDSIETEKRKYMSHYNRL